jgi:hypothetical protein
MSVDMMPPEMVAMARMTIATMLVARITDRP